MQAVLRVDRKTGATTELLPEAMRQQWQLTRDGETIVYTEDITSKTDYDVIGGSEQKLLMRAVAGGSPQVVFPSLRNIRLVWDKSGRRFAYLQGDVLRVGTLGDTTRTRVAGDTTARGDTSATARARRARERFTPVSWVGESALVATNPDGLWLLDVASGQRTRLIASSDSVATSPRARFIGATGDGASILLAVESR